MIKKAAFAIFVLCSPAVAQVVSSEKAVPLKSEEKLICHTDDVVGSRISKHKVCMTAAQWREASRDASEWMDKRTQQIGKPGGG